MMTYYNKRISRFRFNKNLQAAQIFILAAAAIILTVALVAYPATVRAAGDLGISRDLESAVLMENWQQVINLIDAGKEQPFGPVLRLLKGHACLAVNQNNQSMRLFLSVYQPNDLKAWQTWAAQFVGQHGDKPVAFYCLGDAWSRLREWDKAIEAFNQALKLQPKHALILNARGAVYAAQGQWDRALLDFDAAVRLAPALADAHASLGALWIQRRAGVDGALAAFNQALKLNPDFAMALNGRGCAYLAKGDYQKAFDDLTKAKEKLMFSNLPVANLLALAGMKSDFLAQASGKGGELKPGMSMEGIISNVKAKPVEEARKSYVQATHNKEVNNLFEKVGKYLEEYQDDAIIGVTEDGRPYIIVTVNGKKIVIWIPQSLYEKLKDGNVTYQVTQIGNITVIIIYVNGVPVWEIHIGPGGKIIYKGPPKGGKPKPGEGGKGVAPKPAEHGRIIGIPRGPVPDPIPPLPPGIIDPPAPMPPPHFGQKLAQECRQEEQFWSTVLATIARVKPEAAKISPGGITAEDLRHAYVDRGQWLNTAYGLSYAVAPAKISPTGTRSKP